MGCGASKESARVAAEPVSGHSKKQSLIPEDGECSDLKDNGDDFDGGDPEDEASARATKAVNMIGSPESQVSSKGSKQDEQDGDAEEDEDEDEEDDDDDDDDGRVLKPERKQEEQDDLEDWSSETIVSPAKSPEVEIVNGKDYQGVDDLLPKAAAAALEAIVKSAEDDVQAMKVVAAVAAVGDILFGGKEEMETKIEKCQKVVTTLAEVDGNTINGVLNGAAPQAGTRPSGAENSSLL